MLHFTKKYNAGVDLYKKEEEVKKGHAKCSS